MSTVPPPPDSDTDRFGKFGGDERKRAAIALSVLAVAAIVIVVIMVAVLGSSEKKTSGQTVANPTGPAVTVTGGAPASSGGGSKSRHRTPQPKSSSRTVSAPRTGGPVSCPTSAPCVLPQDVGGVVAAINAYRAAHGRSAVTGVVTRAAQTCAIENGDLSACHGGYYWEPVGRSGQQVVNKIAQDGSSGTGWLLDPKMTRVQVGWAYLPSSHSFYCAVISND